MDVETIEIPHENLDETLGLLELHDERALPARELDRLAAKRLLVGSKPSGNKVSGPFISRDTRSNA